ncbi:MAG TPA: alpha-D-ribose 1-methylphosphonate 5-triphosphate diphosphatase [Stellaceae bacterium]|nr:alpha-D-ribose 1-methylphosphonate 5-triphosphate diphosphatase [Stellaceae bacterium]
MSDLVLDNARLVLRDRVVAGHLVCRDGQIAEIGEGCAGVASALDLDGDFLLPGLVELHTDNLERHVAPRPNVRWPMMPALLAHDAQLAAAGITTVLDALAIVDRGESPVRGSILHEAALTIAAAQEEGLLRAGHLLHLRCEVSYAEVVDACEQLIGNPLVRLVSLMDHTPGQRQFTKVEHYYAYYQGKFGYSAADMEALVERRIADQRLYADVNRRRVVALCRSRHLALASHDDATVEHVMEALDLGMTVAEFPTTLEAACLAHERGMAVIMGAPNVVRGSSHSGNVSARALAAERTLDILSSDYVPSSLLHGAFLLHADQGIDLAAAVAAVSATPAQAIGLDDRGEIAIGQRADLVRARLVGEFPVVREVWRAGSRIV